MGRPIRELQRSMSSAEFALYQAYYEIEPWGEDRADLRMGITCSTMANIWRGKKAPAVKPKDFMPQFDRPQRTAQDIAWRLDLYAMAHNAKFERKR